MFTIPSLAPTAFEVFRRTLTVSRTGGHFDTDGIWVNSSSATFTIKASIQATDAEILQTLPEGYRTKETHTLHTSSELRVAGVGNHIADAVTINGVKFQVVKVTPWQNIMLTTKHYEAVVVKVDDDNVN